MKFRTGAKITGSGKFIEVELEDSDMADLPSWSGLTLAAKFKTMSTRADILIVNYLYAHGDISQEYAEQRVREIQQAAK